MDQDDCVFFLYDSVIGDNLKEEDDPAEAISYFYPSSWSSNEQCWLCGCLTGLSKQMYKILGQPPELIRLRKRKFALIYADKYVIALGVPVSAFSDVSTGQLCEYLLDIFMFFFPSLDSLIGSLEKQSILDSIINTSFLRPWTDLEFQTVNFTKALEQNVMLKCSNILNYTTRHNGIFGCALMFQKRVVQSLLSQRITRLAQLCVSANICCRKVDCQERKYRFAPVFVSSEDHDEMVKKQKLRHCDISWEESSLVQFKVTQACFEEKPSSATASREVGQNLDLAKEDVNTHHDNSQGDKIGEKSSVEGLKENAVTAVLDPSTSDAELGAKELVLYIIEEGSVALAVLMERYYEEHSNNVAEAIHRGCIRDLRCINETADWMEIREDQPAKQSIDHSSLTGKIVCSPTDDKGLLMRALVATAQDEFKRSPELSELHVRDSKNIFKCNKLLGRTTYFLSPKP